MAKQLYAGIDLGGTNIKYGLVDRHANIVHSSSVPTGSGRLKILKQFALIASELEQVAAANRCEVFTIGVGSPGIVDIGKGKVVGGSPNVAGWRGTDIKRSLQKASGLEVCADNDANVMALAEHRFGAGKGKSSGLYITVGTGLGSGIILNNSIWRGAWFAGAELGHSIINFDGVPCQCGKRGCLEMYVNAASFAQNYGRKVPAGSGSKYIFDLARAGDELAIAAIKQSAEFSGNRSWFSFGSTQSGDCRYRGRGRCRRGNLLRDDPQEHCQIRFASIGQGSSHCPGTTGQ